MEKEQESKAIFLPAELYRRIEERAKATSFGSVEEYVRFVLEEVLKEEKVLSRKEEEEVKEKLRALSYLD
ncbi:CopG family transcriptional regulator [Dehalococcoidia bacterium]|nr:CopG family transcriptional regulator [Dehalococcoidia bacterium]